MPMRNRVTPLGDIVAIELRGAWLGNRGVLHENTEIRRFHASDLWITCRLRFRDRHMKQWQPHHYTHLYFHDEAVSFAAGHRPCAECRRADYNAFRAAWAQGLDADLPRAKEMDRVLHAQRLVRGTHRRRLHRRSWRSLPSAAFVLLQDGPARVRHDTVLPWTTSGYAEPRARPQRGDVEVITPPASLAAFEAGYEVQTEA
ncbi:MAG TPA: hypothetical protein VE442_15215 [Jatrophihabitans sp.]|nr:hypothetical protein [Jatrophihabitans sp.]